MTELERWETRFDTEEYVFGTAPNAFLRANVHRLPPVGRVLCIADGEGRNGVWLAGQGFDVVSQDFSANAQGKAEALARERGAALTFERSDITTREWEADAFDAVVGIFFQFLGPEDRARVFDGVAKTVRPGGVVLIEGYGPKQLEFGTGGPKSLDKLYTPALLKDAFVDFAEIEVREYEAELSEGARHVGMSGLIDMVARK